MIIYYDKCEVCRNIPLRRARNAIAELRLEDPNVELDERYVGALRQWKDEALKVGAKLPFLYSPKLNQHLELDDDLDNDEEIKAFLAAECR